LNTLFVRIKKKIEQVSFNFIRRNFSFVGEGYKRKFIDELIGISSKSLSIVNPDKTLEEICYAIINKKCGTYMRFGDGDVLLSIGQKEMLQQNSSCLSIEMKEAFALNGEFIFKSLSIHSKLYGYEKEMYEGNHLVSDNMASFLLSNTFPYFIGSKIYSPISLHYTSTYYPEKANLVLKIIKKNCILFIGNESTPANIINKLFGDVQHVKTPYKDAYSKIDEIETNAVIALENQVEFGVVVVAMGCSGRPLMKRLYQRGFNIFLFDFGSLLDGICGNKTRLWLEKERINYSELLKDL